ncbi:hypothetical protein ACLB2K_073868 [Fragaria x ananassa]
MAALVSSASLMSVSAFYIHKRSVDQVSDRLIEIRRKPLSRLRSQHSDDKVDDKEEDDYINEEDEGDEAVGEVERAVVEHGLPGAAGAEINLDAIFGEGDVLAGGGGGP